MRHRHFGTPAIALALFLFGVLGRAAREVHRDVSGWGCGSSCWRTLARWIEAARSRLLFGDARLDVAGLARRAVAAAVARFVQAAAPASAGDDLARLFAAATSFS